MVKDWVEALKKGQAWLAGDSQLSDSRSKWMLAGTLAFVAVLLVGLVVLGSSKTTAPRAAPAGIRYGHGTSRSTTTTTAALPFSAVATTSTTTTTTTTTAANSKDAGHHGARMAAAGSARAHLTALRGTRGTNGNWRTHRHLRVHRHPRLVLHHAAVAVS
jgi:hypothetical protein